MEKEKRIHAEFKEILNFNEISQIFTVNGEIHLNLIDEIEFVDNVIGFNNLQENQILVDPHRLQYTLNKDGIELLFTQCDVALRNVFIEDGARDVKLNYSPIQIGNTVEVCNRLTIDADINDDDVTESIVDFGDSTIVTGPPTFDGKITLPTLITISIPDEIDETVTETSTSITRTTTTTTYTDVVAIELGNVDEHLSFNKPVRVEFPGAGEDSIVGFTRDPGANEVTFVTIQCNEDSQEAAANQLGPGEACFIQVGPNLVFYTTEFSGFGFAKASTSSTSSTSTKGGPAGPAGPSGSGGGGGGGVITGDEPSPPSYPEGYAGILGPQTTGFGVAKFSNFIAQLDDGRRSAIGEGGCFVDTNQTLTISVIIDSKSPLTDVDLRIVHEGVPFAQYFGTAMTITKIPNEETKYNVFRNYSMGVDV